MNQSNQVARLKRFMDHIGEALARARNTHAGSAEMVIIVRHRRGADVLAQVLQEDGTLGEDMGKAMPVSGYFPAPEVMGTHKAQVTPVRNAMRAIELSLEARHDAAKRAYNRALQQHHDQQS